jgi:uncharacterized membrane protein YcaP (DUF421 family)
MKIYVEQSPITFILVKNGKIQRDVLALLEKTEEWVRDELKQRVPIQSIQLATVDEKGQINILLKK